MVCKSLRRLRVFGSGEEVDADSAKDALEALNDVMHSWYAEGLKYEHTPLGLNDDFPLPAKFNLGVSAMLAIRIADDFNGGRVTPKMALDAKEGMEKLEQEFRNRQKAAFDPVFAYMNSRNIYNGHIK